VIPKRYGPIPHIQSARFHTKSGNLSLAQGHSLFLLIARSKEMLRTDPPPACDGFVGPLTFKNQAMVASMEEKNKKPDQKEHPGTL
jgi:hypothetical protein